MTTRARNPAADPLEVVLRRGNIAARLVTVRAAVRGAETRGRDMERRAIVSLIDSYLRAHGDNRAAYAVRSLRKQIVARG